MMEMNVLKRVMIAVSKIGTRVFRNNVAQAWVGQAVIIKQARTMLLQPGDVLVRHARPLHAGLCKGSSDLIGITPMVVRPEHVGATIGVFTAFEGKSEDGRATPEQNNFMQQIKALGGIAGIVRDDTDALKLISEHSEKVGSNRLGLSN